MQDFKDMKVIACGQYSQVFSAKLRKENKLYSMKKYIKKTLSRQRIAPNVHQEIEIMNMAGDNPHTVRLYNHFEDRDAIYLVMEFMNNGNMQQKLLKDKKLSEVETLYYVKQMVDILIHLHSLHIVHRNFRLENILIRKNEKKQMSIKLCDFGFSTYTTHENGVFNGNDIFGPEQFNLQPQTESLDIWSLGVAIYQMIVGKYPFEPRQEQLKGKKRLEVLQQNIVNAQFAPSILSKGAMDLLTWIFQINPYKRPTAAQIKEHWWLGGTQSSQRPIEKINIISVLEEQEPEQQPIIDIEEQIIQTRCSVKQKIQNQIKLPDLQEKATIDKFNKTKLFEMQINSLQKELQEAQEKLSQINDLKTALKSELMLKSTETMHFADQRESVVSYQNYDSESRQEFCKIQIQQIPLFEGEKFCLEQGIQQLQEQKNTIKEAEESFKKYQEDITANETYIQELFKMKKLLMKQIQDLEEKRSFMKLEAGIIDIQQEIEKKLRQLVVDQNDKIPALEKFNEIFQQFQMEETKQQKQKSITRSSDLLKLSNEEFPEKKQLKLNNIKQQIQEIRDKQEKSLFQIGENQQLVNQIDEQQLSFQLNEQLNKKNEMNQELDELQLKMDGLLAEIQEQEEQIEELEKQKQEIEQANTKSNIIY